MRHVSRSILIVLLPAFVLLVGAATPAWAKQKAKAKGAPAVAAAGTGKPNACGCYKDAAGACACGKKKMKCGCPGDCEPKGCAEKDAKDMEKQMKAETKRAQDVERKQKAAADKRESAGDSSDTKTHSGSASTDK